MTHLLRTPTQQGIALLAALATTCATTACGSASAAWGSGQTTSTGAISRERVEQALAPRPFSLGKFREAYAALAGNDFGTFALIREQNFCSVRGAGQEFELACSYMNAATSAPPAAGFRSMAPPGAGGAAGATQPVLARPAPGVVAVGPAPGSLVGQLPPQDLSWWPLASVIRGAGGDAHNCELLFQEHSALEPQEEQACAALYSLKCKDTASVNFNSAEFGRGSLWLLDHSGATRESTVVWLVAQACAARTGNETAATSFAVGRAREWQSQNNFAAMSECLDSCILSDYGRRVIVELEGGRGYAQRADDALAAIAQRVDAVVAYDEVPIRALVTAIQTVEQFIDEHRGQLGPLAPDRRARAGALFAALSSRVRPTILPILDTALAAASLSNVTLENIGDVRDQLERSRVFALSTRDFLPDLGAGYLARINVLMVAIDQSGPLLEAEYNRRQAIQSRISELCNIAGRLENVRAVQRRSARVDQSTGSVDMAQRRRIAGMLIDLQDRRVQYLRELRAVGRTFDQRRDCNY